MNCSVEPKTLPQAESQHQVINPANPCRALDDSIEHRLDIGRRAADDAENLARRSLLLQSFAQIRVALLEFFEQPHVLDGDHGLGGESFEERDLLSEKGRTSVRLMLITPMGHLRVAEEQPSTVRIPVFCEAL